MANKKSFGVFDQLNADVDVHKSGAKQEKKQKKRLPVMTCNYNPETMAKIKNIAYWERLAMWRLMDEIMQEYIEKWEKENDGPAPSKPKR